MRRFKTWCRIGASVRGWRNRVTALLAWTALVGAAWTSPMLTGGATPAYAKTPGKTYCFNRICHRVKTLAETRREIGRDRIVQASHYDDCRRDRFNPCGLTSSGERFRANMPDNAASPIYPDGTKLLVWNPRNGRTLVVRINNAGPYYSRRLLDLSRAAAQRLGFAHRGVARLHVRVLSAPSRREARYRRNRRYAPVPGYVGKFRSVSAALWRVSRRHGGWAGNPATTMARLAMDEDSSNPGWLSRREMNRTTWRLRRLERKSPAKFVRFASLDIPLPKSKAGVRAGQQAIRFANMEFGVDHARKTHEPATVAGRLLLAALPERRPVRARTTTKSPKLARLAKKRTISIKRQKRIASKAVAAKKKQRRVRLAQLKRKPKATQNSKKLTARKKPIRVASLAKRKSPSRRGNARTSKVAARTVERRSTNSKKTAQPNSGQKSPTQKTATVKSKLPVQAKKTKRPVQRVARSTWRTDILRDGLD